MMTTNNKSFGIGWFAREILGRPLYWYQELIGDAILDSIRGGHGRTFTVMLSRQMGKNQLSAVLEAYLLCMWEQGTIVKAAPTYKPQIINSKQRLLHLLDVFGLRSRVWKSYGYIIGMAPDGRSVEEQSGARVLFFSAGPESHIVGATASLLLEIDEAQDVAQEKYDIDLKPMASTTNATTVLYGTAWSDATLLARMSAHNRDLERQDRIRRHFSFDWTTLAQINQHYRRFVEGEIERLGEDHISIRTQYRLLPISGSGYLLNDLQRNLLCGSHEWLNEPDEDSGEYYIAGCDVGGEDRVSPIAGTTDDGPLSGNQSNQDDTQRSTSNIHHDSTVLTIGRVTYNELDLPCIEVVHQCCWTGKKHSEQYAALSALLEGWNIRRLIIDKTGIGEGLASLLIEKFGDERVAPFHFTRPSKSALTYQFLNMVSSARLKLYRRDDAPAALYDECWRQLKQARYALPGAGLLTMHVPSGEGHDDYLMSLALCCEGLRNYLPPIQESAIIQASRLYEDGRF